MAGNHECRHKQYTFCAIVYEVSSFTGNPVDNQRYLPNCYSDIGLGKVPVTKRRLTREFVNERQKTLIFKSLTKGISSFWKKNLFKTRTTTFFNGCWKSSINAVNKIEIVNKRKLEKTENSVNEMNVLFLPFKRTATWIFFLTVGTNR